MHHGGVTESEVLESLLARVYEMQSALKSYASYWSVKWNNCGMEIVMVQ